MFFGDYSKNKSVVFDLSKRIHQVGYKQESANIIKTAAVPTIISTVFSFRAIHSQEYDYNC